MVLKSDEKGYATFFNVINSGFIPFGSVLSSFSYDNVNLNDVLNALYDWLKEPNRDFQNTSPLDKTDGRLDSKTYCKSIYKCQKTNDLFFVLWKSTADGNGNIQGVEPNSRVDDKSNNATLLDEKHTGKRLIWGLPSYYWYVADLNIFATIKFPHSCIDKTLFERYIRDFVLFRMKSLPNKREFLINGESKNERDFHFYRVTFGDENGVRFRFKIESKQLVKQSGETYFSKYLKQYKYVVIRDTISAIDSDNEKCWFASLLNISKKSKPNIKNKQIEVVMPTDLDNDSLKDFYEYYEERKMSSSEWNNIGFREERDSATKWCNEFIARDFVSCNLSNKDSDNHLSAFKLCEIVNQNRTRLLHGISESKNKQLEEISLQKKSRKASKRLRKIA